jgi:hypothetical protein
MRITVIMNAEGQVAGATTHTPLVEMRAGHPSAWLEAGPDQTLVEVVVDEDAVPRPEADQTEIDRFFTELAKRAGRQKQRGK